MFKIRHHLFTVCSGILTALFIVLAFPEPVAAWTTIVLNSPDFAKLAAQICIILNGVRITHKSLNMLSGAGFSLESSNVLMW